MQNLLEFLSSEIAGQPLRVEMEEVDGIQLYTIFVPKENMGLLIGKGGKTIRAIRSIAKARAIVDQLRVNIQLQEE